MPTSKRKTEPPSEAPTDATASKAPASTRLASARDECLARLNGVAAQVQELSTRMSADLTRALNEAQSGALMRQQAVVMDYLEKLRQSSTRAEGAQELNEISRRCADDLQLSNNEACKGIDETREKARAAYDAQIDQANREWDAICHGFVDLLRQRLARAEPPLNDSTEVAEIGRSMTWIASLMRKPAAGG
jgi:hypothetical protein